MRGWPLQGPLGWLESGCLLDSTNTPQYTSNKFIMVSIRLYLGYLRKGLGVLVP